MPFPRAVRDRALVASGRSCCICHKFCGAKIECHHIIAEADGGSNDFDNCIPLCLDCHADQTSYDFRHPKGTKYSPQELREHRRRCYEGSSPAYPSAFDLELVFPGEVMLELCSTGKQFWNLAIDGVLSWRFETSEASGLSETIAADLEDYVCGYLGILIPDEISARERVECRQQLDEWIAGLRELGSFVYVGRLIGELRGGRGCPSSWMQAVVYIGPSAPLEREQSGSHTVATTP